MACAGVTFYNNETHIRFSAVDEQHTINLQESFQIKYKDMGRFKVQQTNQNASHFISLSFFFISLSFFTVIASRTKSLTTKQWQ